MHKLRIVNPSRESGGTQGTEVWLDDRQLQGVTRIEFLAEIQSIYHVRIDLNVRLDELSVFASPELRATEADRLRLAAIRKEWNEGKGDEKWLERLSALIEQESTL